MNINGIDFGVAGMDCYQFQEDAVRFGVNACLLDGGCLIAHDTGLGKTNIANHIAMYLINHIKQTCETQTNVLVFTGSNHKIAWNEAVKSAKIPAKIATYRTDGLADNKYSIIVIDEAHDLRNASSLSYQNVFKTIRSIRTAQGMFPYVVLLTATPFHNNIKEYRTLLSLIPFRADSAAYVQLPTIFSRLEPLQKDLNNLVDFDNGSIDNIFKIAEKRKQLEIASDELTRVVSQFAIRETRKTIEQKYPNDMTAMGRFPLVVSKDIETQFELDVYKAIQYTINLVTNTLKFAYQSKANYAQSFKAKSISMGAIAKVNLLKRLDSSVAAFKESLENMIFKIETEIENPQTSIKTESRDYPMDVNSYIHDLNFDLNHLKALRSMWLLASDKQKVGQLLNIVKQAKNDGKKIVIFSEFYATLNEIETCLVSNGYGDRLIRFGEGSDERLLDTIDKNFNANNFVEDDFDILICTDKLAQGVNLHQASYLVHFDQKWNPQRLVQREGRINRIIKSGIPRNEIYVYTFTVNSVVEAIIGLQETIGDKIAMAARFINFSQRNISPIECIVPLNLSQTKSRSQLFYEWETGSCDYSAKKREGSHNLIGILTTRGWIFRRKNYSSFENIFLRNDELPKNLTQFKGKPISKEDFVSLEDCGQSKVSYGSENYMYNSICSTSFDVLINKHKEANGFVKNATANTDIHKNHILLRDAKIEAKKYCMFEQPYVINFVFGNKAQSVKRDHHKDSDDHLNDILDMFANGTANGNIFDETPNDLPVCLMDGSLSWQEDGVDVFQGIKNFIGGQYSELKLYDVSTDDDCLIITYKENKGIIGATDLMKRIAIHRKKSDLGWNVYMVERDGAKSRNMEIEHLPAMAVQMVKYP